MQLSKINKNDVRINRELQRLGFGDLKDPTLAAQFAACIRDHAHFRGILMHIPEGWDRVNWYRALSGGLRFIAKPLEDYERESKAMAESNQLPTYDPKTLEVKEFKVPQFDSEFRQITDPDKLSAVAEEAINRDLREGQALVKNTLICHKCTKQQEFRMKHRRSLFKLVAEAGWFIDNLKAYCPNCKPVIQ